MISERIGRLQPLCAERGKVGQPSHFMADYHRAALQEFAELSHADKLAAAMAFAICNQDVWCYPEDTIGGRIYYKREAPVDKSCPELDYLIEARQLFERECPEADELIANQLIGRVNKGHITWFFDRVLRLGIEGMKRQAEEALAGARDEAAQEFYRGVSTMLDALQDFNDKHIAVYESMGNHELAGRMKKVPRYPAETFREAVQAFFMQHIVVMRENPFGGNGPGRLDYYLWPYLENDLREGRCTLEGAKEIVDELFLRLDERIHLSDRWVEAIVVGGTHPNGTSAVNPLTYLMIRSIMDLNITHPSVYVRMPENPPEELVALAAEYMLSGNNRAQILYDPAVIGALEARGIPYRDAVEYACGGCMEVGVQGMTSDYLYIGWQNVPKMLELMITGGISLCTGERVSGFRADGGLASYGDFESFYRDFIAEADRLTKLFLHEQDIYSELAQRNRPSYLISSMLDDCMARGRNMHAGGAKYHDYGGTHLGLPNVADGLLAIRYAVFDKKICTADELVAALKADFVGYERLQAALRRAPKYGVDDEEADALAARVMGDFADMYLSFVTRHGGRGKPVILTFTYSPKAAKLLGATADGRRAHQGVAHGVTPASGSMREGLSAALNSCGRMPFHKFAGGASTMWDFDSAWATNEIVEAVLRTFMEKGGQIFQGNTTPLEELLDARKNPERYEHLMVRVGGYSARFIYLEPELQEEIIGRMRHGR